LYQLAGFFFGLLFCVIDQSAPVSLAVIEVVGGQLYLAVMVARLVSAWR
jgi:hypothetical protein